MQITTEELVKTHRGRNVNDGVSLSVGKERSSVSRTQRRWEDDNVLHGRRPGAPALRRVMPGDRDITRLPIPRPRGSLSGPGGVRLPQAHRRAEPAPGHGDEYLPRAEQDKRIDQLLEEFTVTHLRKEMGFFPFPASADAHRALPGY